MTLSVILVPEKYFHVSEYRTWILKGKLDDYLLSCGASDSRILADRYSKEVEKELLQNEITEEIGYLLGLRRSLSKSSCGKTLKVGDDDCRTIYFWLSSFQRRPKLL